MSAEGGGHVICGETWDAAIGVLPSSPTETYVVPATFQKRGLEKSVRRGSLVIRAHPPLVRSKP